MTRPPNKHAFDAGDDASPILVPGSADDFTS
jgi:hypothetical protein